MQKSLLIGTNLVLYFSANLLAGPAVCDDDGGPTICVRFDDISETPILDFDYEFNFSNPQAPSVDLKRGEDEQATMYEWRVWSKNAQGAPAAIGNITAPGGFNYSVKIFNDSGGAGATEIESVILDPSGDKYSNIAGGHILEDIGGDVTLVADSGGNGGQIVDLLIQGGIAGELVADKIDWLVVEGLVSGSISANRLISNLGLGIVSGEVEIASADAESFISLDALSGTLTLSEIDAGNILAIVVAGVGATGEVNLHAMGTDSTVHFGSFSAGSGGVQGRINLWEGVGDGAAVRLNSKLEPISKLILL